MTTGKQQEKSKVTEKIFPQIIANIVACLSAITVGLLYSWSSPFMVKITKDKENYDITEDQASYFTYMPPIGMILASPVFSKLADIIGRKGTLLLITIPHLLAWILTIVSTNVYVLYGSRFCAGLGDGCLFSVLPMYIGEISTPRVRGIWGNLINVLIYFGVFLINVLGTNLSVKVTAYICISLPFIFFILMSFMPESPYYYIIRGKDEQAKRALRHLRSKEDVEDIYLKHKTDIERQMSERGSWRDLFLINSNRKALIAGLFLRGSQQLGGAAAFIVYTQYIFDQSGANLSSSVPTMIYTGLCFSLIFVAGFVVELIGRRRSYIGSLLSCGIVLLLMATYFYIDLNVNNIDLSPIRWFPVLGMILYIIFCAFGLMVIPTLMLGELFSASIKSKGMSILTLNSGVMMLFSNYLFYILRTNVGMYGPFLVFGICNIISTILTIFLVPETRGKTLEEIQQSLKKPTNPS